MEKNNKHNKITGNINTEQQDKWIRNLSQYNLSETEKRVLAKGLKFAITPDQTPVDDYIVATELVCKDLPASEANELRCEVVRILSDGPKPKSNITKEEITALKNLSKEKSIVILPAHKGSCSVVMDQEEYSSKVNAMLSDERTYKKVKKDPSENTKKQLIRKLASLKEQEKITDSQYKYLYPTTNNVPRLYCTPKIYKQDNPLCPIVDYSGSANYNLGRSLADLLNPLMGQTEHHLQNSKDLKKKLEDVQLQEGEILISHDIVSLFTNVPIQESLNVIRSRLEQDDTLKDRTRLSVDDILDLLEFVCDSTYFQFEGQLYKQCFGTAMGSPVSPIIANLFMEHQEQLALQNCPSEMKPSFWYRYVDDIGESVKEDQADNLTAYLNTVDKTGNIKYTSEREHDRTLPMLDVKMMVTTENRIQTTVYRKKTHTDQYLNFESHHPLHQKIGVIRSLLDRKEAIVSTEEEKKKEDEHITQALRKNNYPMWAIKKAKTLQSQEKRRKKRKHKRKTVTG